MNRWNAVVVSSVSAVGALAGAAGAGPDWAEGPPGAGPLPPSAQTVNVSPLHTIEGELKGPVPLRGVDPPDFEDMYAIFISEPALFSARTDRLDADGVSFAEFDSRLWLFDRFGRGVIANNDSRFGAAAERGSFLAFPADDGTPPSVPAPGVYYLAISGAGNAPLSPGGNIFNFGSQREISGPDGPGGSIAITNWTGPGEFGNYLIALTGVGQPCPADLDGDGAVGSSDLAILLGSWGTSPGSPADLNDDGQVNAQDLALLLGSWGPCTG